MSQTDSELIQRMGVKPRCPICQAVYRGEDLRLVREANGRYLFYILCPSCFSSIINIILNNPLGTSSLYMVTDFTGDDLERFVDSLIVNCDEVIETYEKMKTRNASLPR
ncbi:MAG: hypothetical protein WC650_03625 [Candidatus Doudnabacteria bacterium]